MSEEESFEDFDDFDDLSVEEELELEEDDFRSRFFLDFLERLALSLFNVLAKLSSFASTNIKR